MKEKLKVGARALYSTATRLCGSVTGYSGSMMIISCAYALINMISGSIKARKKPRFYT